MADDYEPNALGITGSVVLGFTGLDACKDVGDIAYGIYNWEWTWSHAEMMAFNLVSLAPVIGAAKNLKYADKVLDTVEITVDTVRLIDKCEVPRGGLVENAGRVTQSFVEDLSHITGKAATARNRAIESVIREDLSNLKLTHQPQYSPFVRTGMA